MKLFSGIFGFLPSFVGEGTRCLYIVYGCFLKKDWYFCMMDVIFNLIAVGNMDGAWLGVLEGGDVLLQCVLSFNKILIYIHN